MQVEENKTVDIDTSGPDTEVELKEDQTTDTAPVEETEEPVVAETQEASSEPQDASDEKQEAETSDEKEIKKEELEEYSQGVQRRIAKLTKKWREAERQRDEALTFAKTQKEQREALQKRYSSVEEAGVKDREAMIQSGLSAAQAKLAAARESGDLQAEVDANKEIAMLGYQEARLREAKMSLEEQAKQPAPQEDIPSFRQQAQDIPADPKAEAWGAKNPWFGKDTAMTYTAFDLHKKLVDDEGYDPASDEYYSELDKRLRVEFPHKFANTSDKVSAENSSSASTKPVQQVASAKRSTKTGRKTVRLTPSQVAIAKKLGVPLEEYAKQLKLTKEA
jgi:hypothetical protein